MSASYPDIQYDEQTRRINRRIKFAFVPIVILVFAGIGYGISQIDLTTGPVVVNDTKGNVVCVRVTTRTSGFGDDEEEYDHSFAGVLAAGEEKRIASSTACSVFTAAGDYQGCLFLPSNISKEQPVRASDAQTRVKAEACVYPR